MKPEELKPLVENAGGVSAFSKLTGASERAIYAWLAGERTMMKTTENLIRRLPVAKLKKQVETDATFA